MRIAPLLCAGCTIQGPVIEPIDDQIVAVGDELRLELHADQPDLAWSFASALPGVDHRAALTERADGAGALFRFRPEARDLGRWVFDFRAEAGAASIESTTIEVRLSAGGAPTFTRPLGAGTAVDGCVTLEVVVADADSTAVNLRQVEPLIAGAELVPDGPFAAAWRWCPDDTQRTQDRFLLALAADDGDHPPTILYYQLVLRGCDDDSHEEDDGPATARWLDLADPPARSAGNQICAGDGDWYGLVLAPGETLHVVARFDGAAGDLDLRLDDDAGSTVARALAPGSGESLSYTSPDGGLYHLVVHGWQDDESPYDLCAALAADACP